MKQLASATLVLAVTFLWLATLFALRPFDRISHTMDHAFGALPAWTHVNEIFHNPLTQEVSHGAAPLKSFRILADSWAAHPRAVRVMLMGNSQALMASLAAGEPPPKGPEKMYTDHIAEDWARKGSQKLLYRLAAGGLSYQEMLWYAGYLADRPEIKPHVLLVQLNYQSFASGGIRGGMLELLSSRDFSRRVEEIARRHRPHSDAFAKALSEYRALGTKESLPNASAAGPPPGERLETAFRKQLDEIPGFNHRDSMKDSFANLLLRCRIYLLRLGSVSKRSLVGSRVAASRSAIEDLVELCGSAGIRVILFHAATNPEVSLYATPDDDRLYHEFAASVASRHGLVLLDFEHRIPAGNWGMSLKDPDPLHLSRQGHRRMADLLLAALAGNGI